LFFADVGTAVQACDATMPNQSAEDGLKLFIFPDFFIPVGETPAGTYRKLQAVSHKTFLSFYRLPAFPATGMHLNLSTFYFFLRPFAELTCQPLPLRQN
jgi:hypothetical protein